VKGNDPSGSIKGGEFLDQLSDYYLFKDSTPWSQSNVFKMASLCICLG
jgi:hypothetical protein